MSQVINTNIMSLNAQRNLSTSQSALAQSLERLSSGLRINSAKDDAAGLAISERMTTQIRGLNQAIRNANDGVSLAQTAESALGELTNNLQRIRELAVQAANASNSASDRQALDQEVQQRLAEIDRIASQTAFNDQRVLDGTLGSSAFQIGANVGETISVELNTSMRLADIGTIAEIAGGDLSGVISAGEDAVATTSGDPAGVGSSWVSDTDGQEFTLTIDGETVLNVVQAGGDPETIDAAALDTAIAAFVAGSDGAYSMTGTLAGDDLVISKADGTDMTIAVTSDFNTAGAFDPAGFVGTHNDGEEAIGPQSLTLAAGEFTVQVGSNDAVSITGEFSSAQALADEINTQVSGAVASVNDDGGITINASTDITLGGTAATGDLAFAGTESVADGSLLGISVTSVAGANDTMLRIDAALTETSSLRGTFGAIQNRFESTIANLSAVSENLSAARSRIMDADFASETAELTRAQILQQAGVSILSQANAQPQLALSLLQ